VCASFVCFGQKAETNEIRPAYQVPANRILEFRVPLSQSALVSVANSKNQMVYLANAAIAVPTGFKTNGTYPILVVNGTSDGDGSSVRALRAYTNVALPLGWVVIAADGPNGKPTNDTPPWRYAMLSSVLDHVNKSWPASRKWPMASVGFSGGAKWAAVMAAILSQKGYNLMGLFMGGCNEDLATQSAKLYEPKFGERSSSPMGRFKQVPIYLSSGLQDKIATPDQHESVHQSLLNNGFSTVRLENYDGGHLLSNEELKKALEWFMQLYNEKLKAEGKEQPPTDKTNAPPTAPEKPKE
jgi:surfactin synthase thioesterase subunit